MVRSCSSCAAAAQWLAARLLTQFDWQPAAAAGQVEVECKAADRYARLAAAGVVAGQLARRLAETEAGVCPEQAHAAGLLHAAPDWLAEAAVTDVPADHAPGCLPRWLADPLTGVQATGRADAGSWACAGRAVAMLAGLNSADAAPGDPLYDLPELERVTQQRWRTSDEAVHQRLPALTAKLQRLAQLEQQFDAQLEADKLEAMKELAFGAGHEINNPLANISARAQTLLKDERDPERRRKLAAINRQAFRAHEMIADLMLFARPPKLRPQPIDLLALIDTVVGELAAEAAAQGTALEHRRPPAAVFALADEVQLAVVLRALCVNALEALGRGGQVWLAARTSARGGVAQSADVVVSDTGPGIRAEIRRHLFDPFFSGREAGRGLGFGLSKCWRIVHRSRRPNRRG